MKKIIYCILAFGMIFSPQVYADLKQESNLKILGVKKIAPVKKLHSQSDAAFMNKQKVQAHDNMLRCWQNGKLILAEHDWDKITSKEPLLKNRQQQKLYAFHYGETFCVYLGD